MRKGKAACESSCVGTRKIYQDENYENAKISRVKLAPNQKLYFQT